MQACALLESADKPPNMNVSNSLALVKVNDQRNGKNTRQS